MVVLILLFMLAYAAACAGSGVTVAATQVALAPPPDWNGPFGQGLNTAATAFGVIVAFFLGLFRIGVVNSM